MIKKMLSCCVQTGHLIQQFLMELFAGASVSRGRQTIGDNGIHVYTLPWRGRSWRFWQRCGYFRSAATEGARSVSDRQIS